ncbi:hypothetical protein DQ04_00311210 [Trypanosoma grayi]|uniref:hypothetical protein n=1 Tax=Trypanosoma grayi TaxID=71804 RepID=UPI0004F49E16|nr:hypothetical protein DQ04_00311210 [Trypanosoma grayi]KEG14785.1 hypothetical protein DQ04_00311210 [Trypanosoma grayi]
MGTEPKVVLPAVDRNRRRNELLRMEAKAAALEAVAAREQLERLERRVRSVICGREHEKRYRLLWHYQEEKARVERETAVVEARALALQRERYTRGVRDFQARGHVLHLETVARAHTNVEEADARRHIASLLETVLLEERARQAAREADAAVSIFHDLKGVRDWECRIAEASFRPTRPFTPTTQLVTRRGTGTGGYHGRTDLLMDYAVCEEEWHARINIVWKERVAFLPLEFQHSVAQLMYVEEPRERAMVEEPCRYGSFQAVLSASLRIQRWWRMLRRTPWQERRREALRRCVAEKRNQMTSHDFHLVLDRMRRQPAAVADVPSPEEVQKSLAAVERAAELAYKYELDYFVYTLMNRAANLQATEAHRLCSLQLAKDDGTAPVPPIVALLRVPYRVYVRQQPLQPYPLWRALRWVEGSTSFLLQAKLQEAEAAQAREALLQREAKEADTLRMYHAALKRGAWAWRSLYTSFLLFEQDEEICRGLVQSEEQDSRAIITGEAAAMLTQCYASAGERWHLLQEETRRRQLLADEERDEFTRATAGEWRWHNLLQVRIRLKESCGGKLRWKIALNQGLGWRFLSLDTAACVLQRFFRVALARVRRARGKATGPAPEAVLVATAADMMEILSAQFREGAETVRRGTSHHGSAENRMDTAVGLFSAWFDEKAHAPMEREYKEIVARFLETNRGLYQRMHLLFAVARKGRERIAQQEAQERDSLCHTDTFFFIATHELGVLEAVQRQRLEAEAEVVTSHWHDRAEVLASLTKYTSPVVGTTAKKRITAGRFLPRMSCTERLLSREEVARTRVLVEERQERCAFVLSLHAVQRDAMVQEEQQEREAVCERVDSCCPASPPVAQLALLMCAETAERRAIEDAARRSYALPLERGCLLYAQQTLLPQFLRGHLSFASEARHFDRHLTELLLRRVALLGSKRDELVAAEVCARARVEHLEEVHRRLYLASCFLA